MVKKKRKYTHKKDRPFPMEHGSMADDLEHAYGGSGFGRYKTRRKGKRV